MKQRITGYMLCTHTCLGHKHAWSRLESKRNAASLSVDIGLIAKELNRIKPVTLEAATDLLLKGSDGHGCFPPFAFW